MSKMNVVVAGDWHGDTQWGVKVVNLCHTAWDANVLLHLGDFGVWPGPSGARYLDALERAALESEITILVVPGNHEDWDQIESLPSDENDLMVLRPHIRLLPRGYWFALNDVSFLALGGAVSIDRNLRTVGTEWWMQEVITQADVETAIASVALNGSPDVMLTHECPAGVDFGYTNHGRPIWFSPEVEYDANYQRLLLREVLDHAAPRRLIHGHHHRTHSAVIEGVRPDGTDYETRVLGLANERLPGNVAVLTLDPNGDPRVKARFPFGSIKKNVMAGFNAYLLGG